MNTPNTVPHSAIGRLLDLARQHRHENDSAALAYRDALRLYEDCSEVYAARRALASLRHSVGINAVDYFLAWELEREVERAANGAS